MKEDVRSLRLNLDILFKLLRCVFKVRVDTALTSRAQSDLNRLPHGEEKINHRVWRLHHIINMDETKTQEMGERKMFQSMWSFPRKVLRRFHLHVR